MTSTFTLEAHGDIGDIGGIGDIGDIGDIGERERHGI
jgi:hypothetical protein